MSLSLNYPNLSPSLLLDFAGTKQLDPRITFTRASTATFYNGVTTAKAEENLFTFSQEIDNVIWAKNLVTVTANSTTAPDGTTTADSIVENSATTDAPWVRQNIVKPATATTYTFSAFVRPSARTWCVLTAFDGASVGSRFWFNLTTGTIGTTAAVGAGFTSLSHTISASTNGFFRVSCTFTTNAVAALQCFIAPTTGDGVLVYAGTVGQTAIFAWGAQLEQRSAVTAYTVTTTQPITNYIPVLQTAQNNVARFDHNPITGESLGLEIEEQRTNLVVRSEEFNNASWIKSDVTLTANTTIAPNGTLTAAILADNTNNAQHLLFQSIGTVSIGTIYTFSVFAKAYTSNFLMMTVQGGSYLLFNLSTGTTSTVGGTTGLGAASMTPVGNGWYRCSVVLTTQSTIGNFYLLNSNGVSNFYTGTGTGVFIWGAQLEAGAFPTSYIPTVASQVTRSADLAIMTGTNFSSWYNTSEGTIYFESATVNLSADRGTWAIGNNAESFFGNHMYEVYAGGLSGQRSFTVYSSGTAQAQLNASVVQQANTFSKGASAYARNNFAQAVNSVSTATDTSGNLPLVTNGFSIGNLSAGWAGATVYLNGTIKKVAYYPARLTNAQLQAITTV